MLSPARCAPDTLPVSLLCSLSTTTSSFHLRVSHATSFCRERHSSPVLHMAGSLSSHKSSLNVTSSERLSVAICICQGPGGKQWHTHMRVIQDSLKGQFIKGWSKTNAEHKEGAETTLGWKDEEAGHSCSQRRVILHKEAGRIKTSSLILLNILEARGHKKPIDTVTPPGQRPE